jgi:hypothetical protein
MIRKIHTDLALFVLSFAEVSVFNIYTTDKLPFRKNQVMNSEVKLVRRLLCLLVSSVYLLPTPKASGSRVQQTKCEDACIAMVFCTRYSTS